MRTVVIVIVVLVVLVVLAIAGCLACGGGLLMFSKGMIEDGARQAIAGNEVIEEKIGTVESLSVNFQATGEAGGQNLFVLDIKGSKGAGQLIVQADAADPSKVMSAKLRMADGEEVDLDIGAPAPEPATP